jgi:hypothetical protein
VRALARAAAVAAGVLGAAAASQAAPGPVRAAAGPVAYVANTLGASITEYAASAGQDAAPIRTITGAGTGLSTPEGVAVDAAGEVFAVNAGDQSVSSTSGATGTVTVYGGTAEGNATPVRTIAGPSTGLTQPQGIAVDSAGTVYVVADASGNSTVNEYRAGASGDTAPVRRITGLSHPGSVALDSAGDVYVTSQDVSTDTATGSVRVYAPGLAGGDAPLRTIAGPATGLSAPQGVAVDGTGVVHVLDTGNGQSRVVEFPPGQGGNLTPLRTLVLSPATSPQGLAVDPTGVLYVSSRVIRDSPALTARHAAPGSGVTASATGTPVPTPTPSAPPPADSVAVYGPAASGTVAPLRTIAGPRTGLQGPRGLAVAGPVLPVPPPTAAPTPRPGVSPAPVATAGPILPLSPASPSPGPSPPPPPAAPPPTGSPSLLVEPATGPPGEVVTAHGLGYPPGAEVTVVVGDGTSHPMTTPGVRTAMSGELTASFRVPALAPGAYLVVARSVCCADRRATFTVVAAAPAAAPGRSHLTQLSQAVPDLGQVAGAIRSDLGTVAQGLALAALMLLLVGFPAELFNRTLEENYEEVRGWFGWLRGPRRLLSPLRTLRPPHRLARHGSRPAVRFAAFCVAAAAFSTVVDPDVLHHCHEGLECTSDWWTKTVAVFLGFLVAVPVTTLLYAVPEEAVHRSASRQAGQLRVLPLALVAAAVFAAGSVVARFLPGYVYGLVAGYAVLEERSLSRRHRGLAVLVGGSAVLAMSLLIWLAWGPVHDAAERPGAGLGTLTLDTTLAQLVVLGVQAVVFGLLPVSFLAGARLKEWNRLAWVGLYGTAAIFYAMVLTVSTRETMGTARATGNEMEVIGLFLGFGAFSVLFWGHFRLRAHRREGPGEPRRE